MEDEKNRLLKIMMEVKMIGRKMKKAIENSGKRN